MDDSNSSNGAIVAIIAIIAILAVLFLVLRNFQPLADTTKTPVINLDIHSSTPQNPY